MRRLRFKVKEDEDSHKVLSIDPRGDVVINGSKGFEEGLAPIDPYSTSI